MCAQNSIGSTPGESETWGQYASMFSLCFILSFLLDFGLAQLLTKKIANNNSKDHFDTSHALFIKLISSFFYPFVVLGIGYVIGFKSKDQLILLGLVSLIHVFIQFFGFFRGIIQGKQLFRSDSILSNIDKTLLVIFVLILLSLNLDIYNFVYARILSIFLATLVIFYIALKAGLLTKPKYNSQSMKKLIQSGLPFAFITLIYSINEQVDQVMVERLSEKNIFFDEAGVYSASYRIVNGIMMYLWIILPLFFAKFAHHKTTPEKSSKLIRIGSCIVFLPVAFLSISFIVHGHFFFEFFFDELGIKSTEAMSSTFAVLCFTLLLQGLFAIISTFLTSTGHENKVTSLVTISVVFNLVMNFFFIPLHGGKAAAWTTFGSAIIVVTGYLLIVQRNKLISLPYVTWFKLIIISAISFGSFYYFNSFSTIHSITLGTIAFIGSTVLIRPIRLKELKSI